MTLQAVKQISLSHISLISDQKQKNLRGFSRACKKELINILLFTGSFLKE